MKPIFSLLLLLSTFFIPSFAQEQKNQAQNPTLQFEPIPGIKQIANLKSITWIKNSGDILTWVFSVKEDPNSIHEIIYAANWDGKHWSKATRLFPSKEFFSSVETTLSTSFGTMLIINERHTDHNNLKYLPLRIYGVFWNGKSWSEPQFIADTIREHSDIGLYPIDFNLLEGTNQTISLVWVSKPQTSVKSYRQSKELKKVMISTWQNNKWSNPKYLGNQRNFPTYKYYVRDLSEDAKEPNKEQGLHSFQIEKKQSGIMWFQDESINDNQYLRVYVFNALTNKKNRAERSSNLILSDDLPNWEKEKFSNRFLLTWNQDTSPKNPSGRLETSITSRQNCYLPYTPAGFLKTQCTLDRFEHSHSYQAFSEDSVFTVWTHKVKKSNEKTTEKTSTQLYATIHKKEKEYLHKDLKDSLLPIDEVEEVNEMQAQDVFALPGQKFLWLIQVTPKTELGKNQSEQLRAYLFENGKVVQKQTILSFPENYSFYTYHAHRNLDPQHSEILFLIDVSFDSKNSKDRVSKLFFIRFTSEQGFQKPEMVLDGEKTNTRANTFFLTKTDTGFMTSWVENREQFSSYFIQGNQNFSIPPTIKKILSTPKEPEYFSSVSTLGSIPGFLVQKSWDNQEEEEESSLKPKQLDTNQLFFVIWNMNKKAWDLLPWNAPGGKIWHALTATIEAEESYHLAKTHVLKGENHFYQTPQNFAFLIPVFTKAPQKNNVLGTLILTK